jgi:hypothetical protein
LLVPAIDGAPIPKQRAARAGPFHLSLPCPLEDL